MVLWYAHVFACEWIFGVKKGLWSVSKRKKAIRSGTIDAMHAAEDVDAKKTQHIKNTTRTTISRIGHHTEETHHADIEKNFLRKKLRIMRWRPHMDPRTSPYGGLSNYRKSL